MTQQIVLVIYVLQGNSGKEKGKTMERASKKNMRELEELLKDIDKNAMVYAVGESDGKRVAVVKFMDKVREFKTNTEAYMTMVDEALRIQGY